MSLQVCHCGWSKVTTPHGLRIHQGRMGCTLKSASVAERTTTQQQYSWAAVELKYSQKELLLDDYASFNSDTADFYSDKSLQVCHCGWSKVTTYQGLRIHQGKMGCTPKGMRIPKPEQYDGRHMWGKEEEREKSQPTKRSIKQEMPQSPTMNICSATIKEEYNISVALSHYSSQRDSRPKVKRSDREHPPTHREAVVRPKEEKVKRQSLSQKTESRQMIRTCVLTDYAATATRIKVEPKASPMMSPYASQEAATSGTVHQLREFSTDPLDLQVNHLVREAPAPLPAVSHKDKVRKERMLMQKASVSSRDILERAATIRKEPRQYSESGRQLQDSSSGVKVKQREIGPAAAVLQPKDKHGVDHNLSQDVRNSMKANIQLHVAAEKEDSRPQTANEIPAPDVSSGMTVTQLAQMFSANAGQEATGRPQRKRGEESKVVKAVKLNAPLFTATTAQEAAQPQKDRGKPTTSPVTGVKSGESQTSSTVTDDPKPRETAPSSGFITGVRVKNLAGWFSAAAQQETVQSNKEHEEDPKLSQVRLRPQTTSSPTGTVTVATAMPNNARPAQGSPDALRREVDLIFSEVMEVVQESQHKSHDLPLCSLTTATLAMMELIQQKLDKLSSVELKWFSKFAVDIKLDPTTSHRCLVSADGLKVKAGRQNQEACDPPGSSGGVLGLNSLPSDRSYWEVEVSSRTGWDVGIARGNTNHKEKLALNPENWFWVVSHYENKEYAAVAAHASHLSLKEKPQRVGVFVNYQEGRVSFYNVKAQSHIHSFTQCVFTGEIFPYFRVHPKEDGSAADPLTISPVKHH